MASEIERKYLMMDWQWLDMPYVSKRTLRQGYIPTDPKNDVRLFVNFPTEDILLPEILIRSKRSLTFNAIAYEDFANIRDLEAYNNDSGEVLIGGRVEARIRTETDEQDRTKAVFAVKQYPEKGREDRQEFEAVVDTDTALKILDFFAVNIISKQRTRIAHAGKIWEVDCYLGKHKRFVTVDVEVNDVSEFENLVMLPGAGRDITNVDRFRNQVLAEQGAPDRLKLPLQP